MTLQRAYALGLRNALACENAREKKCRCHCGGSQHGKAHSLDDTKRWAIKQAEQIDLDPEGAFRAVLPG